MISANSVRRGVLAIVVTLLSAACSPTASPAPATDLPAATSTAVTPEGPYATQQAGIEATISARATASPFPSAAPAVLQTGQPSTATVRRGGLALQVRLPKDSYLPGEAGQAQVTLSNAGPETVIVQGDPSPFSITLLNDQGRAPAAWPWQPLGLPRPNFVHSLAPGQSLTSTLVLVVPVPAPSLSVDVSLSFSRPAPDHAQADGPDNIWLPVDTGPIPLQVLAPAAGPPLVAQLQVDRAGWSLRVTDAAGRVPPGPLLGLLEFATATSYGSLPLDDVPGGVWSDSWGQTALGPGPLEVRAWVGAPGDAIVTVRQSVAGPGAPVTVFDSQP